MTPRERILTSLSHQQPDRVPFSWGFGPTKEMQAVLHSDLAKRSIDWQKLYALSADILKIEPTYIGPTVHKDFLDIWGIRIKTVQYQGGSYEEFTDFPLAGIEKTSDLDKYPWPNPSWYKYEDFLDKIFIHNPDRSRALQIPGGNPFELYSWMTGLEETMMNLLDSPEIVQCALEYITDFLTKRIERMLIAAGDSVDLVFFADDLGSQTSLLMSREIYRNILQPFHRRMTDCVRKHAPHAKCMFHTDGAVFDIIPDLLNAGIDILEAVQPEAAGMDPQRLKTAYGNRLSFHGAISVQQLLPRCDAKTVASECQKLVEILGNSGGYIAAPSHAIQFGTPTENVIAMLKAVLGKDDWERVLQQSELKPASSS